MRFVGLRCVELYWVAFHFVALRLRCVALLCVLLCRLAPVQLRLTKNGENARLRNASDNEV